MATVQTKAWWQSRTIWINVLSIALEILNLLLDNPIIPPKFAGFFTMAVNIINIFLRFITKKPIEPPPVE